MAFAEWRADPAWRTIDLLSDVHLHADAPRTFEAWRSHLLATPADAVLILGDLFEVWVGDDARQDGFAGECAAVLGEAARSRVVAFMHGNRDFLLGQAMCRDCGMQALADPTVAIGWDQRLLLTHGDALCLADTDYQRFRQEVRSRAWQELFLALPLGQRLQRARSMRDASTMHQASKGDCVGADVDEASAVKWLDQAAAQVMIHGHTHRPARHALPGARVRHVLGDWDFETSPPRARVLRWTAQGLAALNLGTA